jgi:hypothetical protein
VRPETGSPCQWQRPIRSKRSSFQATCGFVRRLRSIHRAGSQGSAREYPRSSSFGALDDWTPAADCSQKIVGWGTEGPPIELISMVPTTWNSNPAGSYLVAGRNTTTRQRTMRASGCNSFSIAMSIEGMPIAVSRTGLSGGGLGRVKTRPLVGPLERSSSRSRMMQWAFDERHPPATDCSANCRRTSSGARPARPSSVGARRGRVVR